MMYGWPMMGWIGMILVVLFWVAIIGVAVWLLSRLLARGTHYAAPPGWAAPAPPLSHESPLDIAKRRYASGEISKAEYDQIRQDLMADQR